jgi:hypothetical protein
MIRPHKVSLRNVGESACYSRRLKDTIMTLRKRIQITVAWLVIGISLAAVGGFFMVKDAPRREWKQRAAAAGSFGGLVVAVGCGVIWLPYAAAVGKKRREERERARHAAKDQKRKRRRE